MNILFLLALGTLAFATAALVLWRRTHEPSFLLGLFLLYYFTILGAWVITAELLGADTADLGFRYGYLFERLFPVSLNEDYWLALFLYFAFLLAVALTLLVVARPRQLPHRGGAKLSLAHDRVLVVATLCAAAVAVYYREALRDALSGAGSAYALTRTSETDPTFAVAAVVMRMAIVPAALGLAVIMSGPNAVYIRSRTTRPWHRTAYVALLAFLVALAASLGNKNELLFAAVSGLLFYRTNNPRNVSRTLLLWGSGAALLLGAIEIVRGLPLQLIASSLTGRSLSLALLAPFQSNEMFAAHLSMYGVLHNHVERQFGASLINLLASVVPRILWPDRPPDIYAYYATSVNATEGQGYTIHHATGWYLNFGIAGVLMGGVLLGLVWAALYNAHQQGRGRGLFSRLAIVLGPWTFVAGLPPLVRGGPETYKGLLITSFLVPCTVLGFACLRFRVRATARSLSRAIPR